MRVVLAAREEDGGGGCDGDGVLRLTRVIIVCCRPARLCCSVQLSGTALALTKYSSSESLHLLNCCLHQTGYICQLHTTRV